MGTGAILQRRVGNYGGSNLATGTVAPKYLNASRGDPIICGLPRPPRTGKIWPDPIHRTFLQIRKAARLKTKGPFAPRYSKSKNECRSVARRDVRLDG